MSNVASALTSLLMSLPLVAVPCLAVFGLPSIGPATAEAETDESLELAVHDELGPASPSGTAATPDNPFTPIVDAAATPQPPANPFGDPVADRSQIDPTSDHRGAAANRAAGLEQDRLAAGLRPSAAPADAAAAPAPAAGTAESMSWEAAVARLKAFGIERFHLTNGDKPGDFYFTCSLKSARNLTQRFEAEAPSPVLAVNDVLAQVEKWQATR